MDFDQFFASVGAVIVGNTLSFLWLYAMFNIIKNERANGAFCEQPFHILALACLAPLAGAVSLYFFVHI